MKLRLVVSSLVVGIAAVPCWAGEDDVRVVVGFKGDADADLVRKGGGDVLGTISGCRAVVAKMPAGKVSKLRAAASVAYVEEDGAVEALGQGDADAEKGKPGGGGGTTQPSESVDWGVDTVLSGAHPSTTNKGAGVQVAVIDTGIDLDHPDLAANVKGGVTFVSGTTTANDDNSHGSHVAGTIAAVDNTIGVVGVACEAELYAVKVLDKRGSGWTSNVAAGVDWARTNGMDLVNMSLGGGYSSVLDTACGAASSAGVLVIAAAGNEGDGNLSTTETSYPAALSSVVSVGSTTSNDGLSSFSNTNDDLEVSAPGSSIRSTAKNGGYATYSGTSMATPHAVGIAALLWTGDAGTTRAALQTHVVDLGATGRDRGFGYGRVDIAP